jgi:hypothetical protein
MSNTTIISFDIGIKNMAYCIFSLSDNNTIDIQTNKNIEIIDWKTINLMNEEDITPTEKYKCSCVRSLKKTGKKTSNQSKKQMNDTTVQSIQTTIIPLNNISLCGKSAIYKKNGVFYCKKHAIENEQYFIPEKEMETASLRKMKIEDLINYCLLKTTSSNLTNENIKNTILQMKKNDLIKYATQFFKENSFEKIVATKQKTAKETTIISIGTNMKHELDKIPNIHLITHVIIENQISTIAARMNTIQGMLVQYFIMKETPIHKYNIVFVSSSNKLKGLQNVQQPQKNDECLLKYDTHGGEAPVITLVNTDVKGSAYRTHKKEGIIHCLQFIKNNDFLTKWEYVLNTQKKDDYADCFLQGIWFMRKHSFIPNTNSYNIL